MADKRTSEERRSAASDEVERIFENAGFTKDEDRSTTIIVAPLLRREVVVFGRHAGSDLIFIQEERALHLAAFYRAIAECRTWGELRSRLLPEDYDQAVAQRADAPVDEDTFEALEPGPEEPFARSQLPWLDDFSWPRPPIEQQLEWLPEDVQALGNAESSGMVGGDWIWFSEDAAEKAATRLTERGYDVRRDDSLCCAATDASMGD